ncbi:MAG: segregation and condensation protein A [Longimicrobiales bacterium]
MNSRPLTADVDDPGFIVELEQFQGPLDLLLHLIRSQDIDIFDIPIATITGQFLRAIEGVAVLGLDRAGEFLEAAAMLVRIKAQMLLPRRGTEGLEGEDPRAELVRRLLEYEHFRELAKRLEDSEADRARHYRRGWVPPKPTRTESSEPPPLEVSWEDVFGAALGVVDQRRELLDHRIIPRVVTMEEKTGLILNALRERAQVEFKRLVAPFGDRMHTVVTLLAGLELSKRHTVALRQSEPFAPLWLYRRQEEPLDADHADH